MDRLRTVSIVIVGLLFVAAGVSQFLKPATYVAVVPPYLPFPLALVYLSGLLKMVGGVGILIPPFRRATGWGLIGLLIAVFPANIHMALHPQQYPSIPLALLIARLPLQFVFIAWVYWATIRKRD